MMDNFAWLGELKQQKAQEQLSNTARNTHRINSHEHNQRAHVK